MDDGATQKLNIDIWSPGFHIVEGRGPRETSALALRVFCEGMVHYEERFVTSIDHRFRNLNDFPFDEHTLSFEIVPFAFTSTGTVEFSSPWEDVSLIDKDLWGSADWESDEWEFITNNSSVDRTQPSLTTSVTIDRKVKYFVWNLIIPLAAIVAISWAVFWMNINLAERLSVSITILLTVVAFDFLTSDSLPRLSYTTRLDAFYNSSYVVVAATFVVSIWVCTRKNTTDGRPSAIDKNMRIFFPLAYFALVGLSLIGVFSWGEGSKALAEEEPANIDADSLEALNEDPVPLLFGPPLEASISEAGEIDLYEFCGVEGQAVSFSMRRDGDPEQLLDPFLELYFEDGSLAGFDDDGAGGLDSLLQVIPPPDECLLVAAQDFSGEEVGDYLLGVTVAEEFAYAEEFSFGDVEAVYGRPFADLRGDAVRLRPGEPMSESINESFEFDVYEFCGFTGDPLSVTMEHAGGLDDFLDPFLEIYFEDGSWVTSDDDGAGNLNSLLALELPFNGCYLVIATDLSGQETGDYTLSTTADILEAAN